MPEFLAIIASKDNALSPRDLLGLRGEEIAARCLFDNGYRLVITNFKVPVGRNSKGVQVTGEIDVIALDGTTLCFVEVKTRRSDEFTPIITAVDRRKQRQIARTARVYRRMFGLFDMPVRFDVVTVLMSKHGEPVVELTKGYWNDSVLRRKVWRENAWFDH